MTILMLDDDQSLRDSLRRILRGRDITVLEAAEGGEGLKAVKNHPVDMALIDLFIPDSAVDGRSGRGAMGVRRGLDGQHGVVSWPL